MQKKYCFSIFLFYYMKIALIITTQATVNNDDDDNVEVTKIHTYVFFSIKTKNGLETCGVPTQSN